MTSRSQGRLAETVDHQTLSQRIDITLVGMGYELVDVERSGAGMVRVYIDRPLGTVDSPIGLEDCERVSHQLTHLFAVEEVDYERLEVSSPGLDRPLVKLADFVRFAGSSVSVRLRTPFQGRRRYQGVLQPVRPDGQAEGEVRMSLVFDDDNGVAQSLEFTLAEVDKARLVPQLNFRSNKR